MSPRVLRRLAALALLAVGVRLIPCWWCSREASAWWRGDADLQDRLARGVDRFIAADLGRGDFSTGDRKYDGEWLFATYMMAGMGHGQLALARPGTRSRGLPQMRRCVRRLTSPELRAFDREAWGHDPLASLDLGRSADHGAYLGYLNLLLSLERRLQEGPGSRLNDRITAALLRRLGASPLLLLQSYPGEVYPVDNCAVVGSIGLHARATGRQPPPLLERWERRVRERYLAPDTGLLIQRVHPTSGSSLDAPRGSGTALCAYFTSFALPRLSKDLYAALRRHLMGSLLGFGVVREYPPHHGGGPGDIDSGPVILGYGVSATGFALGPARLHDDASSFSRLLGTAVLFGAPMVRDRRLEFVSGGPLGNAILFAMLTASREGAR
jgi:hypothetical protein